MDKYTIDTWRWGYDKIYHNLMHSVHGSFETDVWVGYVNENNDVIGDD